MCVIYFIGVLFIVLLLLGYMFYTAVHDVTTYETVKSAKITQVFQGFTCYFISDIHRRKIKAKTLKQIRSKVDVVFIGGDLVEKGVSLERMRVNIQQLKRFHVPVYFVWGNNDFRKDQAEIRRILLAEDVIVLEDDMVTLTRGNDRIQLVGFNYHPSIDEIPLIKWGEIKDTFTILLTHTPNSFFRLPKVYQDKMDFVLAGHTHGGQIRFYRFGLDIRGGTYVVNQTQMFISEGYGYRLIPFRFQTKAQSHVIRFESNENK